MKKTLPKIAMLFLVSLTLGGTVEPLATPTTVAQAKTKHVWIAVNHGKKYHFSKRCRGLNHAGKLKHVKLSWDKHHHYKRCGFEK
ncbi:hypothetical protein [Levilactobacillus senmaizukei]|nr:hypothetical protein [Levilactobacillus senmaizukei]